MSRVFFDSNVLLYSVDQHDERRVRAAMLLRRGGAIGVQCLNEFAWVALRKLRMPWERVIEARDQLTAICSPIIPLSLDVHRNGMVLAQRHQFSVWDGMIVAAALSADCDTLYSEDMHDGLVVDGRLTIVNPFAQASR